MRLSPRSAAPANRPCGRRNPGAKRKKIRPAQAAFSFERKKSAKKTPAKKSFSKAEKADGAKGAPRPLLKERALGKKRRTGLYLYRAAVVLVLPIVSGILANMVYMILFGVGVVEVVGAHA